MNLDLFNKIKQKLCKTTLSKGETTAPQTFWDGAVGEGGRLKGEEGGHREGGIVGEVEVVGFGEIF